MKIDNYFYINNETNFYLDNINTVEHFNTEIFKGPKGQQGNLGYTGPRGLQGLQGDRGMIGLTGDQGDIGQPGYRGISGERGLQGTPGEDGIEGNAGLLGYVGPRGKFGPRGTPGPKGTIGEKGMEGPAGFMGQIGDIGSTGDPGEKNPPFETDDTDQGYDDIGALLSMDGFSNKTSGLYGEVRNPYVTSTISYDYSFNSAKKLICPPNTYLRGFSFKKNGELLSGNWGSSNGSNLDIGWKAKGRSVGNGYNRSRQGLPHSYKANCYKLNGVETTASVR